MRQILIGGAWPYANGSLHIGHIAGLLPGDVLARYHRAIGDKVYFVSGSDCHGTPVAIRAKQENKTPQEVSDFYHKEFVKCFERLGFSYDAYIKTSANEHKDFVRKYVHNHNGELLGTYGNFVNRTLAFVEKYCDGVVPQGYNNLELDYQIDSLYIAVGKLIENGYFKDAINIIFDFIRNANKFFDAEQPWITRNTNKTACDNTLYQCVQMIANLAVLLSPFLPFSSEKVLKWLNISSKWERQHVASGYLLSGVEILFQRIDKKVIEKETEKLKAIL